MTAAEIITKTDSLCPNQYTTEDKAGWLSELDGKVYRELWNTHIILDDDGKPTTVTEKTPYSVDADGNIVDKDGNAFELLIPFPYGEEIYIAYLEAKIGLHNYETKKYNLNMEVFNNAYQGFCNQFNFTHMPIPDPHGNRFKW